MTTDIDSVVDEPGDGEEAGIEAVDLPTSRRSFVSKGAIAAAIGAAAGIALSDKASAANGDDLNLGDVDNPPVIPNNVASNTTRIIGGSTFQVLDGNSAGGASIYGTADGTNNSLYGVRGQYDGTSNNGAGVYGYHSNTSAGGIGVKGQAELGTGVYGVNSNTSGGGTGVHGETEGTSGGTGVLGESNGTEGYGVRGRALGTQSIGVSGEANTNASVGVSGQATTSNGIGVRGNGGLYDFSAAGSGILRLTSAIGTDVTSTSSGSVGMMARNADGSLWYCYAADMWQQVAPTSAPPNIAAYNPVTPFRVFDSRRETDGAFSGDENRTVSVAASRDVSDYSIIDANAVPSGATAITGNVVAIGTTDTGFLAVNPGGTVAISASTLNWVSGQNIANGGTFTLNGSREVEIVMGPGNGCHVALDVTGYYT